MTALVAGFALGLAGSGHCAVMCGPLLLALRRPAGTRDALTRSLVYQGGRIGMYALLGLAAGTIGMIGAIGGLGRWLAILTGTLLIASALARVAGRFVQARTALSSAVVRTTASVTSWIYRRPGAGTLAIGAANGLLPCSLVYGALAAAVGIGAPAESAAFMVAFGAGTLPVLMSVCMASRGVTDAVRGRLQLAAPLALLLVGVLLIGRGMGIQPMHAAAPHHHAYQAR